MAPQRTAAGSLAETRVIAHSGDADRCGGRECVCVPQSWRREVGHAVGGGSEGDIAGALSQCQWPPCSFCGASCVVVAMRDDDDVESCGVARDVVAGQQCR